MLRAENINPSILVWARETAGLSLKDAARKIGLGSSARASAIEKIEALERGEVKPTRTQLLKVANTYRRPLTTFYRHNPPPAGDRGEDFRSLPGPVSAEESALLDALLRDLRARQNMVRSILMDGEDASHLSFVNSLLLTETVSSAAQHVRQTLKINTTGGHGPGHEQNSPDSLFSDLRRRIEDLGVFVILAGNLGSYHTNISEKVFRGFAITDDIAPFIVINPQEAKTARSFTLIHELVHIFIGSTGISAVPSTKTPKTSSARIERFCNDVAGEFLLPENSIPPTGIFREAAIASATIRDIAQTCNVSEPLVAYRFWRTRRIPENIYRDLCSTYSERWEAVRTSHRGNEGHPTYHVTRKHALGNSLVSLVGRTLRANELTHTKAAKILGVKTSGVEQILKSVKAVNSSNPLRRR